MEKLNQVLVPVLLAPVPLSFHLNPIGHTTIIKSNIVSVEKLLTTKHEYKALPRFFIDENLAIVAKN